MVNNFGTISSYISFFPSLPLELERAIGEQYRREAKNNVQTIEA